MKISELPIASFDGSDVIVTTTDNTKGIWLNNNTSRTWLSDMDDTMKQTAKNKLVSDLDPIQWHKLEDNTMIMVCLKGENETKTCRTSLLDLKQYLLVEILEALKNREGVKTPSPETA
jgi:hypothetical protein